MPKMETNALESALWLNQRRWFCWWPVGMGAGIFFFFSRPTDPSIWWLWGGLGLCAAALILWRRGVLRILHMAIFWASLSFSLGFGVALWRTNHTHTTFLQQNYGPISLRGQVLGVDFTPRGPKYTLQVNKYYPWRNEPPPPATLPEKISLTVPAKAAPLFDVGESLYISTVTLTPWPPPLTSHDHRRLQQYFANVGARAVALSVPKLAYGQPPGPAGVWLEKMRHHLTLYLYKCLPGQEGAIAAALITGKKSALSSQTYEEFSNAGLSHLLAISGLHLSLVASIFYFLCFGVLRCFPRLLLRYSVHRAAIVFALMGAGGYALLSGWAIPVQRAYTMLLIVMTGLYLYRQAFSMRSVALAATLILFVTPENLLGLSFQLSFASVVGLIAFFEAGQRRLQAWVPNGLARYVVVLLLSSFVASLMTLPFTIFYFHKFSLQALSANLMAIPLTGFAILPLAIMAGISALVGLEAPILWLLGKSIDALMWVAQTVAQWPGAKIPVAAVPGWFLGLFILGMLWGCFWVGRLRWLGGIPAGAACLFLLKPPPFALLTADAKLMALVQGNTLWINTGRANRFQQKVWLESYALGDKKPWRKGKKWQLPGGAQVLEKNQVINFSPGLTCQFSDFEKFNIKTCSLEGTRITPAELAQKGPLAVERKGERWQTNWAFPQGSQRPWFWRS